MALSYDFGAATFGTGGCYVFGVPPSGYPVGIEVGHVDNSVSGKAEEERDILDRLVDAAVKTRPDVLVAVPWVLEGFKERYTRLLGANKEAEAFRVKHALQALKCLGSGGAAMSAEMLSWIKELRINASSNIGMTELGGEYVRIWCLILLIFITSQVAFSIGKSTCLVRPTMMTAGPWKTAFSMMSNWLWSTKMELRTIKVRF